MSVLAIGDDAAVVHQLLDELLDVERVAIGALDDKVNQCIGHMIDPFQDLGHQRSRRRLVERIQRDCRPRRPENIEDRPGPGSF